MHLLKLFTRVQPTTSRLPLSLNPTQLRALARLTNNAPRSAQNVKQDLYWTKIPGWENVDSSEFISYRFQLRNTVATIAQLERFLQKVLPDILGPSTNYRLQSIRTRHDFIQDAIAGFNTAPMSIRLTPHILSSINWDSPLDDPIRRQFITLKSGMLKDHRMLTLDSLGEQQDSQVAGLVHRYPGRALFLATSICPVYCRFCTRSYAVGANTKTVTKSPQRPSRKRWEAVFEHIEQDKSLEDIVVSGGDSYYLAPEDIYDIGDRLLRIPHIRRFRFASKGLAVAPGRILDRTDPWTDALVNLSNRGRDVGKQVCLHTHFNHPNEISWITKAAARYLFKKGVIVRNQSVLLKGINDSEQVMERLIKALANMNIQPYYVYQCDLVRDIEDLRTPLSTILRMDKYLRGRFSGFMMPAFVVDLPGGGGKRLASTVEEYDAITGVSTWRAPGLENGKGDIEYKYYDPYRDDLNEQESESFMRKGLVQAVTHIENEPESSSSRQPMPRPHSEQHPSHPNIEEWSEEHHARSVAGYQA